MNSINIWELNFTDKALECNEKDTTVTRNYCHYYQHTSRLNNLKVLRNDVNNFHLQLRVFIDSENESLIKYCQRINVIIIF